MAIKLSAYYWLRNNYLVSSLKEKLQAEYWFNRELESEDKKKLKDIVEKLDELKDGSHFRDGKPIINDKVMLLNVTELEDVTSNPNLAAKYLEEIHQIFEKYSVQVELYTNLSCCFQDIGMQPDEDISDAIQYAKSLSRRGDGYSNRRMCWQSIKELEGNKQTLSSLLNNSNLNLS